MTLRVLALVRVLNLVALLAGRPLLVLSGDKALDRVGSSAPCRWRFSHNLGFNFLFGRLLDLRLLFQGRVSGVHWEGVHV